MRFEELDHVTRQFMLAEFEAEQASGSPYVPKNLSAAGRQAFPDLMRSAIREGDEQSLITALRDPRFWEGTETYERGGVRRQRRINVDQAAERLGLTEFNTWYVRGLAKRLMDEGVQYCEEYRAAEPKWQPADCSQHEGKTYPVREIYEGHRRVLAGAGRPQRPLGPDWTLVPSHHPARLSLVRPASRPRRERQRSNP